MQSKPTWIAPSGAPAWSDGTRSSTWPAPAQTPPDILCALSEGADSTLQLCIHISSTWKEGVNVGHSLIGLARKEYYPSLGLLYINLSI